MLIVWNGCDSYIEVKNAEPQSIRVNQITGATELITRSESFTAFEVSAFDNSRLETDEDGELVIPEDVFLTETGNWYKS